MHSVRANIIIKLYFLITHFLCQKKLNKFLSDVVYLLLSYIISAKILIFGYRSLGAALYITQKKGYISCTVPVNKASFVPFVVEIDDFDYKIIMNLF